MRWKRVASMGDLETGPRVFREGPLQIVLFRHEGQLSAIDNRCPHEGYPLAQGTVSPDGVLTCNWHNWKFRLADGTCLVGGDHVRHYPVREEDGAILVDITPFPPDLILQKTLGGLEQAFQDRDFGRICREISRLHFHGLDPEIAVSRAIDWSYERFQFGTTHAYAAAADWLTLGRNLADSFEDRLICLAEVVDHMAHDALRRPAFSYPETSLPWDEADFREAVEREDQSTAESLVRGALEAGLHWKDLELPLARAALDHYNDFGHTAIYVQKTGELVALLGAELEPRLLLPLVRSVVFASREDLIPEFRDYRAVLDRLPDPLEEDRDPLEVPFPVTLREAFTWLERALGRGSFESIRQALLEALTRNLLHFDTAYGSAHDRPVSDNVGWLDFTHGLTFAQAAGELGSCHPELRKPALLQMACFLGRNRKYLDLGLHPDSWRVDDDSIFRRQVQDRLLDHGLRDPIFSAHLLKTWVAVDREAHLAPGDLGPLLLAAYRRFLEGPLKQKHVRRLARQAIGLVGRDFS